MRGQVTTLAPQVAGHVAEVLVQDHDMVKAGDLLVWIDDRTAREKVAQAEASAPPARRRGGRLPFLETWDCRKIGGPGYAPPIRTSTALVMSSP